MFFLSKLLVLAVALVSVITSPSKKEWIVDTPEITYKVSVSDDSSLIPPESMKDYAWLMVRTDYQNGTYTVELTDGVCVKDLEGNTLKIFKDFDYQPFGCFQPKSNNFAVKLKEGGFAIYDLDTLSLIDAVELEGMDNRGMGLAFSTDGEYFYDIEYPKFIFDTDVDVYRTSDYQKVKTIELEKQGLFAYFLEFEEDGTGYILGATIEENGCGMIGILGEDNVTDIQYFPDDVMVFLTSILGRKLSGYEVLFSENSDAAQIEDFQKCSMETIYNLLEE